MKASLNILTDTIQSIYRDDDILETRKDCYCINLPDLIFKKTVKKGFWKHLKDENGNPIWDTEGSAEDLKPLMGYEISNNSVKVDIVNHPVFWNVKEIVEAKYARKFSDLDYTHIYFEEFIDENNSFFDGLNFGKKICFGSGIIKHPFALEDNKIFFDCEYDGEFPKIEISMDDKSFVKIDKLPFIRDFRKTQYSSIVIKINDYENPITAYCIGFNGKGDQIEIGENIGRGIIIL